MNKIAIIGSRGYPHVYSGYETFVKELIANSDSSLEFTVYCHKNLFDKKPDRIGITNLIYLPAIKTKSLNQLSNSFLATLHAVLFRKFDAILYVNTGNGPFGVVPKLFGIPIAMITDGVEWKRPKWKGLGAKYFYSASKFCSKIFDVLIADSSAMRELWIKEFKRDSVLISYGAYIPEKVNANLPIEWKIKPNEYYLIVGRMIPDNNVDLMIRGFLSSNSPKRLVVVGDAPFNDAYASAVMAINDERLIFTGYVTDKDILACLYQNCFVYMHGHEFGGTNPTLLKALAYGCAIMAIDTVFSKEVLGNGEYGLFFDKNESNIAQMIDDLDLGNFSVNEFKSKAVERIKENYLWPEVAIAYKELFLKMQSGFKS